MVTIKDHQKGVLLFLFFLCLKYITRHIETSRFTDAKNTAFSDMKHLVVHRMKTRLSPTYLQ